MNQLMLHDMLSLPLQLLTDYFGLTVSYGGLLVEMVANFDNPPE